MGNLFKRWLSALLVVAMLMGGAALAEDSAVAAVDFAMDAADAPEVAEASDAGEAQDDEEVSDMEEAPDAAEVSDAEDVDAASEADVDIQCDVVDEVISEGDALELAEEEAPAEALEALDLGGDEEEAMPLMAADSGVAINATNFPDANFRQYVKSNFDNNPSDNYLSASEIAAAREIDVDGYEYRYEPEKIVASLKGVEYFTRLERLVCSWCKLTSLDVSKNTALTHLDCAFSGLKTLDVSRNTALVRLICDGNGLTALDVSNNRALKVLSCYGNSIATLDVHNLEKILPYVSSQYRTADNMGGYHGGYKLYTYSNDRDEWTDDDYVELCYDQTTTLVTQAAAAPAATTPSTTVETPAVITIPVLRNTKATVNLGSTCQIDLGGSVGKKYKSSKRKVATVDSSGQIITKGVGKTRISFKVGKKRRTLTLKVVDPTIPSSVALNMSGTVSVKQGDTVALTATLPAGTSSGIKWKSSRKSVATVTNGMVTFKRKGSVTITATTLRGKKKAKVKFKVAKYDAKKDLANYGWRTVTGTREGYDLVFRKTHTGGYMKNHKFSEGQQIFVNLTWREGGDAIAYDNGTYGYVQAKYIAW